MGEDCIGIQERFRSQIGAYVTAYGEQEAFPNCEDVSRKDVYVTGLSMGLDIMRLVPGAFFVLMINSVRDGVIRGQVMNFHNRARRPRFMHVCL